MPISQSPSQKFLIDLEWDPDPPPGGALQFLQNDSHIQQRLRAVEIDLNIKKRQEGSWFRLLPKPL